VRGFEHPLQELAGGPQALGLDVGHRSHAGDRIEQPRRVPSLAVAVRVRPVCVPIAVHDGGPPSFLSYLPAVEYAQRPLRGSGIAEAESMIIANA
jgi:hypothetical protein